jgi:SPP1 family predicted phage head-tail adaptor
MSIGALDKRVIVQAVSRITDDAGGSTVTWTNVATTWASIEPANGHEPYVAQALRGNVTHKVCMRYRPGMTPANRLLHGTRVFNVQAVLDEKEEKRFLLLLCEEDV